MVSSFLFAQSALTYIVTKIYFSKIKKLDKPQEYIYKFLKQQGLSDQKKSLADEFANDEENVRLALQILENQSIMTLKYQIINRVSDIERQHFMIPNATDGKAYSTIVDFNKLGWNDFTWFEIEGLEEIGLSYSEKTESISGTPNRAGDFKLLLKYRLNLERDESVLNQKKISIIINPNPKSLWQKKPSIETEPYWKPDDTSEFVKLSDCHLLVASKRGRSHANVGSFRDDDFAYKQLDSGWNLVVVADGAGSAKYAREGSRVACQSIVDFMQEKVDFKVEMMKFQICVETHKNQTTPETQKIISSTVYNTLPQAVFHAHKALQKLADESQNNIKDFHTTLVFALFKKCEFGTILLTFGVGDSPVAVLNKDLTSVKILCDLDVGDFGGGTRFLTMPEIFTSEKFYPRFKFELIEDFSYLMLMTDGIYDPKFVVESNLAKIEKWQEFLADLKGENEEKIAVDFNPENPEITTELSNWLDFWSQGNHDDRTLAIVF